ncbi:unnamed protein product (macronuclear) [Paramecium tetraurelia]|uniref:Uncharacterized protein n=1 Tax=Paramecium tetraurelia TaxID=5888 RepID=A0BP48_PARTE|nr:uncharacterized protein GSPATT00005064001 [Paramecium tetraurelia]CAK60315.1 unnamed protein product [Paramecium tetraurelia]|eukprot:XP_001427713.1 hypothetical protein (macronuclear) [Paramecium tetraurelia strain d4-2]
MLQTLFIVVLLFLLLTFAGLYLRKFFRNKPVTMQNQGQGEINSDYPISFQNQVVQSDSKEKSNQKQNIKMKVSKTAATISKNKKQKPRKAKQQEMEAAFQFDADSENENDSIRSSSHNEKQQSVNQREQEGFNFQQISHNLQELVTPTEGMCQEI